MPTLEHQRLITKYLPPVFSQIRLSSIVLTWSKVQIRSHQEIIVVDIVTTIKDQEQRNKGIRADPHHVQLSAAWAGVSPRNLK